MTIDRPRDVIFAFFSDAFNLEKITPPQLHFHIVTPAPIEMGEGTHIEYRLRLHGIWFQWEAVIRSWQPPVQFVDEQVRGPYRRWVHTHEFAEQGQSTIIGDHVEYELPLSPLGDLAFGLVRRQLAKIFSYRQQAVTQAFARQGI